MSEKLGEPGVKELKEILYRKLINAGIADEISSSLKSKVNILSSTEPDNNNNPSPRKVVCLLQSW